MKTGELLLSPELEKKLNTPSFRAIDRQVAKYLRSRYTVDDCTALAGALASSLSSSGHSCFSLDEYAGKPLGELPEHSFLLPSLEEWTGHLRNSSAVSVPGNVRRSPLVLDGNMLYLFKYFEYEKFISERLHALSTASLLDIPESVIGLAASLFKNTDDQQSPGIPLQAAGAILPFFSRLAIISGGPGTGKTTILSKALALLCQRSISLGESLPVIRLAAPTGKAAQRMQQSLGNAVREMSDTAIRAHLTLLKPTTVHRLIETGFSPRPKRNKENPIDADVVVIDEASMIDITMFQRLMDALAPETRLILLGDSYQLASVEAGSVLRDISNAYSKNAFSSDCAAVVNKVLEGLGHQSRLKGDGEPLSPFVELDYSYRFKETEAIGTVSNAIKNGSPVDVIVLLNGEQKGISSCRLTGHPGDETLIGIITERYSPLLAETDPGQALKLLDNFMVLTALNEGRFGREGINTMVKKKFGSALAVRPIKITENSPQHVLFNGDMGVIMSTADSSGIMQEFAWFPDNEETMLEQTGSEQKVRKYLVAALPGYVDAFAITIHNSQGSEFDSVMIILPEKKDNPLMTRELLYTAVTRAKKKAEIIGTEEVVKKSVELKITRQSGLEGRIRQSITLIS
jgi:exodeoxyribonuclease V alpha subunit